MADWIPGISQLKSGFQLLCFDPAGALKTQENFVKQCPVVSQVTSAVQAIAGDSKGAQETQKQFLGTMSNVADGIPVVGHVKGVVHYAVGDTDGGHKAMRSATRSTAVLGAGAAGMVAGPGGAIAAGIAAGAGMDGVYTIATDQPQGYVAVIGNVVKNPSAGAVFDLGLMPVGDGLAGYAGGNLAKGIQNNMKLQRASDLKVQANAMLEVAEANSEAGVLSDWTIKQQYDMAGALDAKATALEVQVNGPVNTITGMPLKPGQAAPMTVATEVPTTAGVAIGEAAVGAEVQHGQADKKKGQSSSTYPQPNSRQTGGGGSSTTSTKTSGTSKPNTGAASTSGSGQDPDKEKLPMLRSSHYISDEAEWIAALLRSLGQLRSQRAANTRGLNAQADGLYTANRAIVTAMVHWVNTADLPEAVRNFLIDTLVHLKPLTKFYEHCNVQEKLVQVRVEFEIQTAVGTTYTLQFLIDVDNEHEGTQAHMGYEIHLNTRKVQVGHVYLDEVPVGRPAPPGVFDSKTTEKNGPDGEQNPIRDNEKKPNGKGKWKCTYWTIKKQH